MNNDQVQVILNGSRINVPEGTTITYEELCQLEGLNPEHNPSVIYSIPGGVDGILRHEKSVPLVEGTIFSVMHTGNG